MRFISLISICERETRQLIDELVSFTCLFDIGDVSISDAVPVDDDVPRLIAAVRRPEIKKEYR